MLSLKWYSIIDVNNNSVLKTTLKKLRNTYRTFLYSKKTVFQPVFLIGCARSGTTILGTTLGRHKSITYLNERKDLWHAAYPNFDVWSGKAALPKLIVKNTDNDNKKTELLRELLFKEQVVHKGKVVLEKFPINSFRLDFIDCVFPNARYIYLHRNGLEVAKSIERICNNGKWYGKESVKWDLLKKELTELNLPERQFSYFEKGLLEWRLSLDYSESFFSKIDKQRYYSLSYQTLTENPSLQLENIFRFLNLDVSKKFISKISKNIIRKGIVTNLKDEYLEIGGENLTLSVENKLRQTAPDKKYNAEKYL